MAGELYALSWSLVDWVARDPSVKELTRGAEDKQTAKWMKMHPQAEKVRWISERCWIYDHPRAGTVCVFFFFFFDSDVISFGLHVFLLVTAMVSFFPQKFAASGNLCLQL